MGWRSSRHDKWSPGGKRPAENLQQRKHIHSERNRHDLHWSVSTVTVTVFIASAKNNLHFLGFRLIRNSPFEWFNGN